MLAYLDANLQPPAGPYGPLVRAFARVAVAAVAMWALPAGADSSLADRRLGEELDGLELADVDRHTDLASQVDGWLEDVRRRFPAEGEPGTPHP